MNKPNKCKNCQWYGKPYWSIINPCDSCPNENDNMTIVQIDGVPVFKEAITEEQLKEKSIFEITIEEKDKEIERLNNIINELEKYIGAEWYCFDNESVEFAVAKDMLDKLKELKEGR